MNEKTSLIEISTLGFGLYLGTYQWFDGSFVNVTIMDPERQERFSSIRKNYYKYADCCLLVYDIIDKDSFNIIKEYIKEIKNNCPELIKVILLGKKTNLEEQKINNVEEVNKTNLKKQRKISVKEAYSLTKENNFIFMETSCVENKNIADAFTSLIELIHIDKILNNISNENENVNEETNAKWRY